MTIDKRMVLDELESYCWLLRWMVSYYDHHSYKISENYNLNTSSPDDSQDTK